MADDLAEPRKVSGSVGVNANYLYNIFYDANRAVKDEAFDLTPRLAGHTKPGFLEFRGEGSALLEQFFKYNIQSHNDADLKASVLVNEPGNIAVTAVGSYKTFSDPSPNETFGRVNRNVAGGVVNLKVKANNSTTLNFSARYTQEQFQIPNIVVPYFSNNDIEGMALYTNNFLPETSWIVRATGGTRVFPNKTLNSNDSTDSSVTASAPKNDDVYAFLESGITGRLTDRSSIDVALGWALRQYSTDYQNAATAQLAKTGSYNFNAPIFHMRFVEQITRRDQFVAGYNYEIQDAYVTNSVLRQEIYAGTMRVLGDQVLLLGRLSYEFNSYSLPNQRFDERACASLQMRYSLSPNIKLTFDVKIDLLASDAYYIGTNTAAVDFTPDRPANYQAGALGLGLVADF